MLSPLPRSSVEAPPIPAGALDPPAKEQPSSLRVPEPPREQRALPRTKRKWTVAGSLPTLFGRLGMGLAVTAVILGTQMGNPEATPRGGRTTISAPAPRAPGQEIANVRHALLDAVHVLGLEDADAQAVLRSIGYLSFSVRTERGHLLTSDGGLTGLEISPDTRISADLSRSGLSFRASPSLRWRADWAPDPRISRLTYNFSTGRFTAEAEGLGPDYLYRSSVESLANEHLRGRIPEAMRQPGYDPFNDPQLEAHVQALVDAITSTSDPSTGAPLSPNYSRLSAPELSFDFTVPADRRIPLPGGQETAWVQQGTRVYVSISAGGALTEPTLQSLHVSFTKPIEIARGSERPRGFGKMDLNGITLSAHGQISLDYELGPEQAVDGVRALFLLAAVLSEPRLAYSGHSGSFERTRLEGLRGDIQAQIDNTVEPQLVQFLRANDHAIGGVSLLRFFGIE